MLESAAIIVFLSSFFGMVLIVFRKIPTLTELPEFLPDGGESFGFKLKKKIKELNPFKNFFYENFLQKIISRIRILTLKTDSQTFNWLQNLKEKMKKKRMENDNYWEEVKKIKNEK